jgi:hypothetical protein
MAKKEKQVKATFINDRLWEQKLSQVYHLLIPANTLIAFNEYVNDELTEENPVHENSGHLYESVIGSAEGK